MSCLPVVHVEGRSEEEKGQVIVTADHWNLSCSFQNLDLQSENIQVPFFIFFFLSHHTLFKKKE